MIALVLGRYRWQRRRALARLGFAEVDPFGRPTFLFITDAQRKREAVARTAQERGTFEPNTTVYAHLFHTLHARFGDGRFPLDSGAQLPLALLALEEAGWHDPSPQLAEQLVRLLDGERRTGTPARVRPRVRAALDHLEAACSTSVTCHPTTAIRDLERRLRAPDPPLDRWLRRSGPAVVDDIVQPPPLYARCLLALLEAWADRGVPVAISFECGADLGPEALPAFFGAGEPGWRDRGFAATRSWRRAVFERFIAEGDGRLMLALDDGPRELGPEGFRASPDFADDLLAGTPTALPPSIRFVRHPDVGHEVRATVHSIVERLHAGADPDDLLVAVADPAYHEPLSQELRRAGLEPDRAAGMPLDAHPLGQALALLLRACLQPLDPVEWLTLADLAGLDIGLLRAALEPAGIHGGAPSTWSGRLAGFARRSRQDPAPLLGALRALETLCTSASLDLDGTSTADGWTRLLEGRVYDLGLRALAERDDLGRRAWATFQGILQALRDGAAPPLATTRWAALTQHLIRRATIPLSGGSIAITGVMELRGHSPPHVWILGATRSTWPAPLPPSSLCTPQEAARLAPADRLAEARYTLTSLIRNLVGRPDGGSLTVSWAANVGGRSTAPSRVVAELLDQLPPGSLHEPLPSPPQPVEAPPPQPRGRLHHPPPHPPTLSVTAVEIAMRCPARHWYRAILRLRPEDPWDPELEPRRRGTALHRIFQDFYQERSFRVVPPEERTTAAAALHRIATRILDQVEAEGGFEPALQAWARGRWLAGLVDDAPKGLLAAWLDFEIDRGIAPSAVEVPVRFELAGVTLVGTVDRVEHRNDAVGIIDYKTGTPPTTGEIDRGLALQPLLYLHALAPEGAAAAAYQVVRRPDTIRLASWFGDRDAIRTFGGRPGLASDPDDRADRLEEVGGRLRAILDGDIRTTTWGEVLGGCTWCAFARICRVVHRVDPNPPTEPEAPC